MNGKLYVYMKNYSQSDSIALRISVGFAFVVWMKSAVKRAVTNVKTSGNNYQQNRSKILNKI